MKDPQLAQLQKEKKQIQSEKSPLGYYSMAQRVRLIKIQDQIREIKRANEERKEYNKLHNK